MNNLEKKQMGLRIKRLREEKGLTQDELAEKLGMKNRATISSYEAGRSIPPGDVLRNLADILDESTDYLLGREKRDEFLDDTISRADTAVSEIGWAIKDERQSQGMTQKELGNLVGEHQRQISSYELDLRPIPEDTLEKIMKAFGMSFPEFLSKYNLYNGYIHPHFEGDVNRQIAFEKAREQDAMGDPGHDLDTVAAHHDGDDWSEDELEEIERFKEFVKLKREKRGKE